MKKTPLDWLYQKFETCLFTLTLEKKMEMHLTSSEITNILSYLTVHKQAIYDVMSDENDELQNELLKTRFREISEIIEKFEKLLKQ